MLLIFLLSAPLFGGESRQSPSKFDGQVRVTLNYLLYLPPAYKEKEKWPLILFLHGSGERGDDINKVKVHGPPRLVEEGKQFPFIVVSPQCPAGKRWEPFELTALLDELTAKLKVDADRVYLTGLSMGGYGTWALAAHSPNRFAAIVPICGGGDPFSAKRIAKLPAWVFHGAKDPGVPLERSQQMVDALNQAHGNVKFTIYPEAGHDAWTATYNNPELYEWLLAQKRQSSERK